MSVRLSIADAQVPACVADRSQRTACHAFLDAGDTPVVPSLDRYGPISSSGSPRCLAAPMNAGRSTAFSPCTQYPAAVRAAGSSPAPS